MPGILRSQIKCLRVVLACGAIGSIALSLPAMAQEVTIVLQAEPDNLDPCQVVSRLPSFIIRQNIVETVTEIDQRTGEVVPRLATKWERLDDLTWRFTLRAGVTFHDGEPLTAEAFIASFERTMNPDLTCTTRLLYFEGVDATLTAVDDLTFDIKTENPTPIMPTLMSMVPVGSPNTDPTAMTREPSGTGPYKLVEWQSGQRIVVEQNPEYWGEKPEVATATYLFREESTVRAAMVATGEADLAPVIEPQDATNPESDFSYLNSETLRIRLDVQKPPLDDIRVRKAINHAIDRDLLLGTVYSSRWLPAKNMVMPSINGYNEEVEEYPYDPTLARSLIDDARADGVPVDEEITFIVSNADTGGTEGPTVMVEMMNEIGLNVRLQILEAQEFFNYYYRPYPDNQGANVLIEWHDNNSGDAGFTLVGKYTSIGGTSKLEDPEVDALVEEGLAAENPQRGELFRKAFARVKELAADVVLFHQSGDTRVGSRIDYQPTPATNSEVQLAHISIK